MPNWARVDLICAALRRARVDLIHTPFGGARGSWTGTDLNRGEYFLSRTR